jgi:stage II sporulation protein GA (sporulation sigma-E factor processing peptidase)
VYYEFYIDQFFVEHLLTGYLLTALAVRLCGMEIPRWRILAGSLLNAGIMVLAVCAGTSLWYFAGLPACAAFVFAGKSEKAGPGKMGEKASHGKVIRMIGRRIAGGMLTLLLLTIGFGGVLEALLELLPLPFWCVAVLAVFCLQGIEGYRRRQALERQHYVQVQLTCGEKRVSLRALIDTGNHLTEPLTGHPVSIIEEKTAGALLEEGWEEKKGFYLIPYHSLGREQGWMQGVSMDQMIVGSGMEEKVIEKPILAIYRGSVSAGHEYQMILHPQHFPQKVHREKSRGLSS